MACRSGRRWMHRRPLLRARRAWCGARIAAIPSATAATAPSARRARRAMLAADADRHASEHDGFGALARRRRESGNDLARNFMLDETLDVAQKAFFVKAH